MDVIKFLLDKIMYVYQYDMNVLGFNFSLWSIIIWTIIGSIIIYVISNIIN